MGRCEKRIRKNGEKRQLAIAANLAQKNRKKQDKGEYNENRIISSFTFYQY